jgi:hypothetical protein
VPCLNVEAGELLEQLGADVRRNLVFDQLAIALRRPGADIARGFPLGDPSPDKFRHRGLRRLDVGAGADRRDQRGQLYLCLTFRPFEAGVLDIPLSGGGIASSVEFKFE